MKSFVKKSFVSAAAILLAAVSSPAQTAPNVAGLPLFFEQGCGQEGINSPFIAHGPGSTFLLGSTNVQFVLQKASGERAAASMTFVEANPAAQISGVSELSGKANYFLGNDPRQWKPGLSLFSKVAVKNVYPGINVVYYGNGEQLEYDFDLAAGIDPKTIAIRFDGAEQLSTDLGGNLVVKLNGGQIIEHAPVAYQISGQSRHNIPGSYRILDTHTATFALGNYDRNLPLVIDPVLSYSTYFGGNKGSVIYAIALSNDGSNSIFVAGQTISTTFTNDFFSKVPPGYQTNFQGGSTWGDAFVAKFDNSGTNPIYFTYLGGNADEVPFGIAIDSAGRAFVTGFTDSTNFPTKYAIYPHIAGKQDPSAGVYPVDAFVTEIGESGTNLIYSTYLGGSQADVATAIAVDTDDNAYIAGYTYSTNLPVQPGAFQSTLQCTNNTLYFNANAFLAELTPPPNTNLVYCSYFGGTNYDEATAITLGESNYIYVAGATASTNFPISHSWTTNLYLNGHTNITSTFDAFVAKFVPGFTNNLTNLVYSTYLGGSNFDMATGITVDKSSGYAYVVGATVSPNFTNHIGSLNYTNQPANNANLTSCVLTNKADVATVTNAFLAQIGWDGSEAYIGYALVFGGNGNDVANGITMDNSGNLFIVGSASSTNFPIVAAATLAGGLRATNSAANSTHTSDAFIIAFNNTGSNAAPLYSAYLGGSGDDFGNAITVDSSDNVYLAGQTKSVNFPTTNSVQTNRTSTTYDGFIAKIIPTIVPAPPATPSNLVAVAGDSEAFLTWSFVTNAGGYNLKRGGSGSGPFTLVTNTSDLAFTNTGLVNGTLYFYVVSATNSFGESSNSAAVSVRPVSLSPPQLGLMVVTGQMQFSWPTDHVGWQLQAQTNSLSTGLGTNWTTVPGTGSTNQATLPIVPANPSVFYRLVH